MPLSLCCFVTLLRLFLHAESRHSTTKRIYIITRMTVQPTDHSLTAVDIILLTRWAHSVDRSYGQHICPVKASRFLHLPPRCRLHWHFTCYRIFISFPRPAWLPVNTSTVVIKTAFSALQSSVITYTFKKPAYPSQSALLRRINSIEYPASGRGYVTEPRLISQVVTKWIKAAGFLTAQHIQTRKTL